LNVEFAIELIGFGGIVPAVVSGAIVWLSLRFLPEDAAARYSAALALAVAFFVGYALLPSWAPLRPTRHWQWMPYLGVAATFVGAVGLARGLFTVERWMLYLLLAAATAWLLVPNWPDLQPPRIVYITAFTAALVLLTVLLEPLPARVGEPLFLLLLAFVSLTAAVVLAVFVSIKFGQIAAIAAAATGASGVASLFVRRECGSRGLIPVFSVIVCGIIFVGHIEPNPPLTAMLFIPAAPLGLWVSARGPLACFRGFKAGAIRTAAVLLLLLIAVLASVLQERSHASGNLTDGSRLKGSPALRS
jgi:FtsH-binding integral membrane protein